MGEVVKRAGKVSLFAFDVDGTLTDSSIHIGEQGEATKTFNVKDGLGMSVALKQGFQVVLVTGRKSSILTRRATELGITDVYQGISDKVQVLKEVCKEKNILPEQVAYVGDDLNDLAAMQMSGFACAPLDAVNEVKQQAHYISILKGGHGAVRDIIEYVLKSQGVWEKAVQSYVNKGYGAQ